MGHMTTEKESAPLRGTLLRPVAGKARPRMEALAEFTTWVHDRHTGIPPALRVLLLPRAEDQFRWRVELDCGCTQEVLTNGRDQLPDDRRYYDPLGQADLPVGQMWCVTDHKDPKPFRDIVGWEQETSHEFPADPDDDPYGIGQEVWAKKQPTPAAARRASIEARLKRAEAEAERLRRELETLH